MTLNGWSFLVFSAVAILCVRLSPSLLARRLGILAFSTVFILTYIQNAYSLTVLIAVLLGIYAAGLSHFRRVVGWNGSVAAATIVGMWGFLFLVKDPSLFAAVNPFHSLPVAIIGISYMVFRGISYMMEAEQGPEASLIDFLNYMLFFPALLAGPIERFREFTPAYATPAVGPEEILPALHRVANGYIKKFVIADNLAVFSIANIGDPAATPVAMLWFAALLQLFLIYMDFSGYCDIAIGIGSLMGVRLRENFARPFAGINIQEFWERWHVSMSSLMRDYIFTPLLKAIYVSAPPKLHWPLIVAAYCLLMMLIALWHGTTKGFVVFGLLHGAVLVAIQISQKRRAKGSRKPIGIVRYAWMTATYLFVSLTMALWMLPDAAWPKFYAALFKGLFRSIAG